MFPKEPCRRKKEETLIQCRDLGVTYTNGTVALEHVNLSVHLGASVAGIGLNGAGKSTLLKAMLGLIPHTGRVIFPEGLGTDSREVAYMPQKSTVDPHFPLSVRDCVAMGAFPRLGLFRKMKREDWEDVEAALDAVRLTDLMDRQISELSGGQFQRMFMARCLMQKARLIFLDEPFAGVDMVSEPILMDGIQRLKKEGKTIFVVYHDLSRVASYFEEAILMNRTVVAAGETSFVLAEKHLEEAYCPSGKLDWKEAL